MFPHKKFLIIAVALQLPVVVLVWWIQAAIQIDQFNQLTDEGGLVENIETMFFFATSSAFFFWAYLLKQNPKGVSYRWFFALGSALLLFVVGMEEISWGQRIFDFESPDWFGQNNEQGEVNLHNLTLFHGGEGSNPLLYHNRIFFLGTVAIFTLPSILSWVWKPFRAWALVRAYPIIPWYLALAFIVWILEFKWFYLSHSRDYHHPLTELKEGTFSLTYFLLALYCALREWWDQNEQASE